MANIPEAIARSAAKRTTSSIKDARDAAMNQFDPRKAIYELGLGLGPLIRQTVAEYKKQQGKDTDKSSKKDDKNVLDIKSMNATNKKSMNAVAAQLGAMNNLLSDIRKINVAQLQAMKVVSGKQSSFNGGIEIKDLAQDSKRQEDVSGSTSGGMSKALKAALVAAGAVGAAGYAYKNREQIGKGMEDFLKGAGMPEMAEIGPQLQKKLKETGGDIADWLADQVWMGTKALGIAMGKRIVEGTKGSYREYFGMATDENGKPVPRDPTRLATNAGPIVGAAAGAGVMHLLAKKFPITGFLGNRLIGGSIGAYAGSQAAESDPELTAMAAGLGVPVAVLGYMLSKGKMQVPAGMTGGTTGSSMLSGLSGLFKKAPAPTAAIGSEVKLSEFGTVGAQRAAHHAAMEAAAQKQASTLGKTQKVIGKSIDEAGKIGKVAGSVIAANSGKIFGALNVALALPGIYEDIQNGDYAAAAITATGLAASLATAGLTGGTGIAASIGIGVGSGLLADQFRTGGNKTPTNPVETIKLESGNEVQARRVTPQQTPGTLNLQSAAQAEIAKAQGGKPAQSQQEMMDIIEEEFKAMGYSDAQIKAVQIAAAAESGLNPTAAGDSGRSIGLFQLNRVAGEGRGFSVEQLSDPRQNARIAASKMLGKQGDAFRKASNVDEAVLAWVRDFERPSFVGANKNGNYIKDMNAYNAYVQRGVKITGNPSNVHNDAVNSAQSIATSSDGVDASSLRSAGLSDDQINSIKSSQTAIRGMQDMGNIIASMLSGGNVGVGGGGGSAPAAAAPAGANKPPPVNSPSSPEKEKIGRLGSGMWNIS